MTALKRVRDLAKHATREQLRDVVVTVAGWVTAESREAIDGYFDAEDIGGALCDAMVCGDVCEREMCGGVRRVAGDYTCVTPCPVLALLPNCPDIGKDDGGDGAEERSKAARAEALWLRVGGEE